MAQFLYWRNKQISTGLLWQDMVCLDFIAQPQYQNLSWRWLGRKDNFYHHCSQILELSHDNYTGLIMINRPSYVTPRAFVDMLDRRLHDDVKCAYVAVNRFMLRANNDLDLDYPDSLEESIDLIMSQCKKKFRRLYSPLDVDGKHFVAVHGLDVFVYEDH